MGEMSVGIRRLAVPFKELAQYIRENFILGAVVAAAVLLVYAGQAFSTDFYMDAEVILNDPHSIYNWGQIGRFGLIALKYLIGNNWYNPYFEAVLFLSVLWITGMSLACLFSGLCEKSTGVTGFISVALFLFFPVYADQFQFRFQSFEIVSAMFMVVFATRYFYMAVTERDWRAFAAAVFFDVFAFGVYQSMVSLQLCFYIALWLFNMEKYGKKERKSLICGGMVHFLISFAIYGVIVKLFFYSGDYLAGQVGWFSGNLRSVIMNLLAYIKRILLALDVFYPITYPACVLACAGLMVWVLVHDRRKLWIYAAGLGGMLASPFFLALAMGTPSPYRAQCMLPFACSALWLFVTSWMRKRGTVRYAFCIAAGCVCLLCQTYVLMRLFYTQDIIRDADRIMAAQIMGRIQETGDQGVEKPIIFIGHMGMRGNGSCYTKAEAASYLSYSVYEFAYIEGVPVETPDYFNTGRILGYFKTMGFPYIMPSVEMAEEAKAAGADMESWPAAGAVRETENYIIIKLSD